MVAAPRSNAFTGLVVILASIMIGWVLHVGADILQPIVIALLLATILQPVVQGLARFRIPPAVTVIALALLLFLGLARLGLLLQEEVRSFVSKVELDDQARQPEDPHATTPGEEAFRLPPDTSAPGAESGDPGAATDDADPDSSASVAATTDDATDGDRRGILAAQPPSPPGGWDRSLLALRQKLRQSGLPEEFVEFAVGSLDDLGLRGVAANFIGGGFDFAKGLLLVVIYMLFIFAEQAVFRRKILSVAGDRREEAMQVLDRIARGIQRYLGVKTVTSLATGTVCYALLVVLGIPYAPLFGFLTFLLNYIPTFGSIVAAIFPTLTALTVEPTLDKAIIVLVSYLAVNVLIGSILEPKILGRELNLSPLVVVISVVVWAGLWGVVGGFLAVPLTSTLQILLANYDNTRPVAVLLSSGPAREEPRWRPGRRKAKAAATARAEGPAHERAEEPTDKSGEREPAA